MKLEERICGTFKGGPSGHIIHGRSFHMDCPSGELFIESAQYGIHDRTTMKDCCGSVNDLDQGCNGLTLFVQTYYNDVKEELIDYCNEQLEKGQQFLNACNVTASDDLWNKKGHHHFQTWGLWPSLKIKFYCQDENGYAVKPNFMLLQKEIEKAKQPFISLQCRYKVPLTIALTLISITDYSTYNAPSSSYSIDRD